MSKILIINSSYRKNSNSNILSGKVAEGAQAAGHTVKALELSAMQIAPCRGCEACLAPATKGCVQRDSMQEAYPLVQEADTLIFTSPIYWFNMSGQLKSFIDRLFAIAVKPDASGKMLFDGKKVGAVFVYGDTDPMASGCVNAVRSLQDTCSYAGAKWLGAVYGSANKPGEIKNDAALMAAAFDFGKAL